MREIKVGCCGFPVSMAKYMANLEVVEVQKTFYRLPELKTATKWREQAPQGFEYVIKAPQLITHPPQSPTYRKAGIEIPPEKRDAYGYFRDTEEVREALKQTLAFAMELGSSKILFQTPASFKPTEANIENLRKFFSGAPRENFTYIWEPRGPWSDDLLLELFRELKIVHAVDPFKDRFLHGEFAYFRLHGRGKGYSYDYSDEELRELRGFIPEDRPSYVMFNNTMMWKNALRFKELLQKA